MPEVRTTSSTGGQKGTKLARFDLIPVYSLTRLAEHFGKGARKYDDHQWRKGYEWSKSYSAIQRHLTAWWNGQDLDVCSNEPDNCVHREGETYEPDTCYNHTGSHHVDAVMWHAFVLREFVERFPDHDDRYKPDPFEGFDFNEVAYSPLSIFGGTSFGQAILREDVHGITVGFYPEDQDQLTLFDLKDIS